MPDLFPDIPTASMGRPEARVATYAGNVTCARNSRASEICPPQAQAAGAFGERSCYPFIPHTVAAPALPRGLQLSFGM